MRDARYEIVCDIKRRLVRLKLVGFWDAETAHAFIKDEQAAVRRVCGLNGEYLVLADLSEFNLQSQVVVGICQQFIAHAPIKALRLAVVAGSGLARIQIKRILLRDGMEAFSSVDEAMVWLFSGQVDTSRSRSG